MYSDDNRPTDDELQEICLDNTIVLADDMTEGLYYADFDMDAIREYRSREMMGNTFRKVRAYKELLNGTILEPFIRDGQDGD